MNCENDERIDEDEAYFKKQTNKQRKRIKRGRVLLWDHPDTIYTKTVGMKFLSVMLVMLLVTF